MREVAYQLRFLRNIGDMVIIHFIDMENAGRSRQSFECAKSKLLKKIAHVQCGEGVSDWVWWR